MMAENPRVLVVDDEEGICDLLDDGLSERGCLCRVARDGETALSELELGSYDVALLDIRLPGISGLDVLRQMRTGHCRTAAVMITALSSVDTAIEAMKLGARDYLIKPFDLDSVYASIRSVVASGENLPGLEDMEAIARGVEARLDEVLGCSVVVTRRTVEIARRMGVTNEAVREWLAARLGDAASPSPGDVRRSLLAEGIADAAEQMLRNTNPGLMSVGEG
jgi:two-component system nitrogen regulation response regulator GlnG